MEGGQEMNKQREKESKENPMNEKKQWSLRIFTFNDLDFIQKEKCIVLQKLSLPMASSDMVGTR